ncbi:MAG TPA: hypothetical protein VGZ93_07555 [Candidatus Methylacidiphilales bacterium]|jgi:hypothetical protein|nr:hypothetical protein [Candidatus Methylacidiphilales bacterium]
MAIQAKVSSTDAIEMFRAKLIVFITKARQGVDTAIDDVRRMRYWLQSEQPLRWEAEIRRRAKALDQATHELRNAELAGNQESAVVTRRAAVNRARQMLTEAEDKLRRVRKWNSSYDSSTDPIVKKVESFRQFINDDLAKAVSHLRNVEKVLEAYTASGAPASASSSEAGAEPASGEPAEPGQAAPSTESSAT